MYDVVPVPVWALALALAATLAAAWAVAVVVARMIAAEAIAADVERVEAETRAARRDVRDFERSLGHMRDALAGRCGCGYLEHVHGALGQVGDIRRRTPDVIG
ncbi:MAG: hypothetical protein ACO3UW_11935 [Candidatus Nanopelagicales bacterium]